MNLFFSLVFWYPPSCLAVTFHVNIKPMMKHRLLYTAQVSPLPNNPHATCSSSPHPHPPPPVTHPTSASITNSTGLIQAPAGSASDLQEWESTTLQCLSHFLTVAECADCSSTFTPVGAAGEQQSWQRCGWVCPHNLGSPPTSCQHTRPWLTTSPWRCW